MRRYAQLCKSPPAQRPRTTRSCLRCRALLRARRRTHLLGLQPDALTWDAGSPCSHCWSRWPASWAQLGWPSICSSDRPAVPSKKPPAKKSAQPPANLHIAVSQRIVGLHNNQRLMPLDTVRFEIGRLAHDAGSAMESKDRARLREHLESATGLSIAELADLTQRWPT